MIKQTTFYFPIFSHHNIFISHLNHSVCPPPHPAVCASGVLLEELQEQPEEEPGQLPQESGDSWATFVSTHLSTWSTAKAKKGVLVLFLDPWAVHTDIKYLLKTWISSEKVERKDRHIEGRKDANKKLRGMGAGWFRGCWVLQTLLLTDAGQSQRWLSRPGYRLCADEYGSLSLQ